MKVLILSALHRPPLHPKKYYWNSFLLETVSTPDIGREGLRVYKITAMDHNGSTKLVGDVI